MKRAHGFGSTGADQLREQREDRAASGRLHPDAVDQVPPVRRQLRTFLQQFGQFRADAPQRSPLLRVVHALSSLEHPSWTWDRMPTGHRNQANDSPTRIGHFRMKQFRNNPLREIIGDVCAYPEQDGRALAQVTDLIARYRADGQLQRLAEAADLLLATPWRLMIDGNRSKVTFDLADELLSVAAQGARTDVLDGALAVVDAELARIPDHLDLSSETLLRAMRGSLLGERHYLGERLEDLAAALTELATAAHNVQALPGVVDPHNHAWILLTHADLITRKADLTGHLELRQQAVDALERALAVDGVSPAKREAAQARLALARIALWERVLLTDTTAEPQLRQALAAAVETLSDLVDNGVSHKIEKTTWFQNLAVAEERLAELDG